MCVESVCYHVPDSTLVFLSREVRRGEGSTYVCRSRGCGILSQVVVMNTILSLCVSGYHRYHLLYVDLYAIYIGYPVPCAGQRFGTFSCCILVLVIVSGV